MIAGYLLIFTIAAATFLSFPSLHVAFSVYAGLWGGKLMPLSLGIPYMALALAFSTVAIKQHFIVDVVSGIVTASGVYWLHQSRGVCLWAGLFGTAARLFTTPPRPDGPQSNRRRGGV